MGHASIRAAFSGAGVMLEHSPGSGIFSCSSGPHSQFLPQTEVALALASCSLFTANTSTLSSCFSVKLSCSDFQQLLTPNPLSGFLGRNVMFQVEG